VPPQYGELRPITGWDRFRSLGHPVKFHRFTHLAFVTAVTSLTGGQPNFVRCLAVSWAGTLYTFLGGFCPLTEGMLPGAAIFYIWAIFVPKISGIGQLLLKLSLVVGWYPFLRHSVFKYIPQLLYKLLILVEPHAWTKEGRKGKEEYHAYAR